MTDLPTPSSWGIYLVTDRTATGGRDLVEVVAAALCGGIRAVQLRERECSTRELVSLARVLRELTSRHGAALLVNDRVDVALACDADGVHLPGHSFAVVEARRLLGPRRLIGVSTHAPAEAAAAVRAGADFAVLGPIYDTPSKQQYGPPLGIDALAAAVAASTGPVLAIGGIDPDHIAAVRRHGAAGAAVIRAVLAAADPERSAAELLRRWHAVGTEQA